MATADQTAIPLSANGYPRPVGWDGITQAFIDMLVNSLGDQMVQQREGIPVTATAAAGSAATLTIPAPAAGLFVYLDYLQIVMYAAAALTGGATPQLVTSTNLPNNPVWTFPTALAIGQTAEQKYEGHNPIKANAAATAVTIVTPALTNCIYRINATYFVAK